MEQKRDARGRFLPKEKVYATGVKGFLPGLVCEPIPGHRKQYKENTVFEESGGTICGPGVMHAAESAMSVLSHFPIIDEKGNLAEFAEVEALAPVQREGTKWATTKMRIGKKLDFFSFVLSCVRYIHKVTMNGDLLNKVKNCIPAYINRICSCEKGALIKGVYSSTQIGSSGDTTYINSDTDYVKIGSSGYFTTISSSGSFVQIGSAGEYATIASSGDSAQICCSGNMSKIYSSGCRATIGSSGHKAQICSSSNYSKINSSGNVSRIVSSGHCVDISCSGVGDRIHCSGVYTRINTSGNNTIAISKGKNSVISAIGSNSIVAAELGSWIILAEYNIYGQCTCAKAVQVDGDKIRPGVKYTLNQGEFKEVK